jgi:hypothetical protein
MTYSAASQRHLDNAADILYNALMDNRPEYIKDKQSGYRASSKNWYLAKGVRVRKARALEEYYREQGIETDGDRAFGFTVKMRDLTPASNVLEQIENIMEGAVKVPRIEELADHDLSPGDVAAMSIPSDILAMMRLSELFANTEGDVFQLIETPMDLSLRPLDMDCPDKAIEKDLMGIYDSEFGIGIDELLSQIWLCSGIYGQAYPLEVWDEDDKIKWVTLLSPKYVHVGWSDGAAVFSLLPRSEEGWTEEVVKSQIPPMAYKSFAPAINEQIPRSAGIQIDNSVCRPVREKSLRFQRYALPPMARAFRAISTRRILEEMIRSTMEGYRNQLWLFLLGDEEHPPSVEHLTGLRSTLESMASERTGSLTWWNAPLKVDVIAPATFDSMSGMDAWGALTQHIYRQLGVHLQVVSGEGATGSLGGSDLSMNVRVLLERTKFKRNQLIDWEKHLRIAIARKHLQCKDKQMEAVMNTRTEFARNPLEIEGEVKEWLMPYYQAGVLSPQTFLDRGGFSYDAELERKKDHKPNEELFAPPPTFSQQTVNPGAEEKTTSESPKGRTPDSENKKKVVDVDARFEGEPLFDELVNIIYGSFDAMLGGEATVEQFISGLAKNVESYVGKFGAMGYAETGGQFTVDPNWMQRCVDFLNSFTGGLAEAIEASADPASLYWRIYLWPQQIRNLGYMYGVQWAMREYGARGWRRVLHPELSETGPCQICLNDSVIMHSIDEPFWDHPNGVCSMFTIAFYADDQALPFAEVPIPKKVTLPDKIREIVEGLGKIGKAIIRRIRS